MPSDDVRAGVVPGAVGSGSDHRVHALGDLPRVVRVEILRLDLIGITAAPRAAGLTAVAGRAGGTHGLVGQPGRQRRPHRLPATAHSPNGLSPATTAHPGTTNRATAGKPTDTTRA